MYGWSAGFGNVPRCAGLGVLRVTHVGGCLVTDADSVEGNEGGVDEDRDDWVEDGADEHDAFDEEDEEGDDGDDHVPVCDAGKTLVGV